jgi:hypothetical protein
MRRLSVVLGLLLTAAGTACSLGNPSAPSQNAIPYAVIYGRIGAPLTTVEITVDISAYKDSASAVGDSSSGFAGSFQQPVAAESNYVAAVPAQAPATYFLNIFATGQGRRGFEGSIDTIRALRVHFDTVGGAPHDSIEVDDSLP